MFAEPLAGMEPCIYHMGMVPAEISYNPVSSDDEVDQTTVKQELDLGIHLFYFNLLL